MLRSSIVRALTLNFGNVNLNSATSISASASFAGMLSGDGVVVNPRPEFESQISGPVRVFVRQVIPGTDAFTVYLSCLGGTGSVTNVVFDVTRFPK